MLLDSVKEDRFDIWLLDQYKGKVDRSTLKGAEITSKTRCLSFKYCFSGEEKYHVMGKTHRVKTHQCLILPPNEPFDASTSTDDFTVGICIDIGNYFLDPAFYQDNYTDVYTTELDLCHGLKLNQLTNNVMANRFLSVIQSIHLNESDRLDEKLIELVGNLMVLESFMEKRSLSLAAKTKAARVAQVQLLEKARAYIHDHTNTHLNLKHMGLELGISLFHLQRIFRDYYSKTPQQYHEELRLSLARKYLATLGAPVYEVAALVGYKDTKYFSRRFKLHFGFSPGVLAR